jgi:beta-glucosidase
VVQLEPARPWFPLDGLRARIEDAVFNQAVLDAAVSGEIRLGIPGVRGVRRHVAELAGSLDYVGLNYYTRWMVRSTGAEPHVLRHGAPQSDLGWEVYPAGLELAARRVGALGKPVLVTEHGFADAHDGWRPRALVESLIHLRRAIAGGVPVRGYFHWSLLDNFEWADGYKARFGLYRVDFADPERPRTRTRSAEIYARIARENGIDAGLAAEAGVAL